MHIEFKPSSDFNNVILNRAPDGAMVETFKCNINSGGENLTAEATWKRFRHRQDYGKFPTKITGYIWLKKEAGLPVPENVWLLL